MFTTVLPWRMLAPRPLSDSVFSASFAISVLIPFTEVTHDHSLLLSSETETPCFHSLAHSLAKNTGGGVGVERSTNGSPMESHRCKKQGEGVLSRSPRQGELRR